MLSLTPEAASLVAEVAGRHGAASRLRIRVVGGGCSGLTWDWLLGDVGERPGDLKKTTAGVTVVVDSKSAQYVRGATVGVGSHEKSELRTLLDPDGKRTITLVSLPNAMHVCGCGDSFGA